MPNHRGADAETVQEARLALRAASAVVNGHEASLKRSKDARAKALAEFAERGVTVADLAAAAEINVSHVKQELARARGQRVTGGGGREVRPIGT